jgi:hypothetical protein
MAERKTGPEGDSVPDLARGTAAKPAPDDPDEEHLVADDTSTVPATGLESDPRVDMDDIRPGVDDAIADPAGKDALQGHDLGRPWLDALTGEPSTAGGSEFDTAGPDLSDAGIDLPPGVTDTGGFDGDASVDAAGVAPGHVGQGGDALGDGSGGPSMPTVDDLAPTRPETPGMDEARSSTMTSKTLDDGSQASYITNDSGTTGDWFVDTTDGRILHDQEALDHISVHLPLVAPGAADLTEPEVDAEWQRRFAEDLESNTHYGEIRMDALKGSEVNPDPTAAGDPGSGGRLEVDPSTPDFADPLDQPVDQDFSLTPDDLDPGTIDPIE